MKKLLLLPLLAAFVLAGCATFPEITPEFQAELDAQTPNTVTIYFGCANIPDKSNFSIQAAILTTDPEKIKDIQNQEYSPNPFDTSPIAGFTNIQEGQPVIGAKPGTTSIIAYKTEVNPQIGVFTGEFGLYMMTVPVLTGYNQRTSYTVQEVLTINKQPGTYYMVVTCVADDDGKALYAIDEVSAQMWAELVEPRIGTYGTVGKYSDPNFARPPAKK